MKTQRVFFASMSPSERINLATRGISISAYANAISKTQPITDARAREVERIARKAFSEFKRKEKLNIA